MLIDGNGQMQIWGVSQNVYFAGRPIILDNAPVVTDRLGSVVSRNGAAADYFPYGEEKIASANPAEKFGTYLRDATGLDYANQRYFGSAHGRFLSSDPYRASGGTSDPGSWNRFAYTRADPINRFDPSGLEDEIPTFSVTITEYIYSPYGPGGGGKSPTYEEVGIDTTDQRGGVPGRLSLFRRQIYYRAVHQGNSQEK